MSQTGLRLAGPALSVLLLSLLLLASQAAGRSATQNGADIESLPPDADNIEIHHVKVVDGVMHENHPVIMYKEDFVSEDYDPTKNDTKVNQPKPHKRLQRIRHQHAKIVSKPAALGEPQEKILFDVLPETPILTGDDDTGADNFEVTQLMEPLQKDSLQKYPKKYHNHHNRQRREVFNPYARHSPKTSYYAYHKTVPSHYYLPVARPLEYQRFPVAGKKPIYQGKLPIWQTKTKPTEPMSIDNRDTFGEDNENSIFHSSNPEEADFSVFDNPRPSNRPSGSANGGSSGGSSSNGGRPVFQSPPIEYPEVPIWDPPARLPTRRPAVVQPTWSPPTSRPPVWSATRTTRRPVPTTPATSASRPTTGRVSNCVWAIVNCCSQGSDKIRYNCFEDFGCHGAFWGVNPCADNIRNNAINSLTRSFP